jgi:hypothetical protein
MPDFICETSACRLRPSCEDEHMTAVARLVTLVDVNDDGTDARRMSVSACHEAVLVDGRRFLLLDDRGWTESLKRVSVEEVADGDSLREDVPDIWSVTSVEDIEETARCVVGPDEPFDARSQEDMEADHWASLSGVLRRQGVVVDAQELKRLPHDVVLSERLLARVGRDAGDAVPP